MLSLKHWQAPCLIWKGRPAAHQGCDLRFFKGMWELEASGDLDYYCMYFSRLFCDVLKQALIDATVSEMLCDRRNSQHGGE